MTGFVSSPSAPAMAVVRGTKYWKPAVIGRPFLLTFTLISVLLVIVLEALLQSSNKNSGLAFGSVSAGESEPDVLSGGDEFGYRYFPTLVSVVYGLLWTWIDHDIKRLEPYYQLSQPGGALARDSLLLNYPYSLVASVPVTAFKRKHWAVFFSGTILVLIFFAVSPLSAAVFNIDTVSRRVSARFDVASVVPVAKQSSTLSASFTFVAYGLTYLGAQLPPFATRDFAILPFKPAQVAAPKPAEAWTATSTRFSADLKCAPAAITEYANSAPYGGPAAFLFTNEANDCSYNLTFKTYPYDQAFLFQQDWNTLFVGNGKNLRFVPPGNMFDDYSLSSSNGNCPNNKTFMAVWGRGQRWPKLNETVVSGYSLLKWFSDEWAVIFCEPVYEQQQVRVTVTAATGAVESMEPLGAKTAFTAINTTYFEDLMSIGVNAASTALMDVAVHDNALEEFPFAPPNHRDQIARRFNSSIGLYNVHGLTGFGLASMTEAGLESLLDPAELGAMFAKAYRLLFAMAMVGELSTFDPAAATTSSTTATRTFLVEAVVVNTTFARLVEGSIGAVLLLSLGLLYTTWGRRCNLTHDPSSIAAGMTAIAGSPEVTEELAGLEWMGQEKLVQTLRKSDRRYRLDSLPTGGHRLMKLDATVHQTQQEADRERRLLEADSTNIESLALDKTASHWELHPVVGVVVCSLFAALVVLLGWLYGSDRKWDGLPRVGNPFQNNIVYNYLPTAIATFTEPFWVLITRHAALVMPYQELHTGESEPLNSLAVNYDSKPPHFVAYRSFRARHFLLAALSIMALGSNVLAVAFGALFNEKTSYRAEDANFHQQWSPIMKPANVLIDSTGGRGDPKVSLSNPNYSMGDIRQPELFYVAFANVTNGPQHTPLPQWTSDEFYFLPFDVPGSPSQGKTREALTRGYGVDAQCSEMPESQTATTRPWKDNSRETELGRDYQFNMWQQCQTPNGPKNGTFRAQMFTGNMGEFDLSIGVTWGNLGLPVTPGWGYIDFLGTFKYGTEFNSTQCPGYFTAGWLRTNVTSVPHGSSEDPTGTIMAAKEPPSHVAVVCKTRLQTAIFRVKVDAGNIVLDSDRVGEWENADDFVVGTTAEQLLSLYEQMISDDDNNVLTKMGGALSRYVRSDPKPYDWVNFLMQNLPGDDKPDGTWPPDAAVAGRSLERVYKLLFAIFIQRYSDGLFSPMQGNIVAGQVHLSEARMEMSQEMFIIAVAILGLFIIVGTITYVRRPGHFLSSLPTSLAIKMSTYYASNAIDDVTGTEAMDPKERARFLKRLGNKYGYGAYVGRDGKRHFGVDREPLVGRGSKSKG